MRTTPPFDRIYYVVSQIPKGKVTTYKEVAKAALVGNPRIVGFALHVNKHPDIIPCHRVVMVTGALAKGYAFGGIKRQKRKLQDEGVSFLNKDQVDLTTCLAKLLPYTVPRKRSSIGQTSIHL